jgi:hypothetical protein
MELMNPSKIMGLDGRSLEFDEDEGHESCNYIPQDGAALMNANAITGL